MQANLAAFKSLTPCGFFLELSNLPYVVDAELDSEECLSMLHRVYSQAGTNVQNLPENTIDEIHEEINRGKYSRI